MPAKEERDPSLKVALCGGRRKGKPCPGHFLESRADRSLDAETCPLCKTTPNAVAYCETVDCHVYYEVNWDGDGQVNPSIQRSMGPKYRKCPACGKRHLLEPLPTA